MCLFFRLAQTIRTNLILKKKKKKKFAVYFHIWKSTAVNIFNQIQELTLFYGVWSPFLPFRNADIMGKGQDSLIILS